MSESLEVKFRFQQENQQVLGATALAIAKIRGETEVLDARMKAWEATAGQAGKVAVAAFGAVELAAHKSVSAVQSVEQAGKQLIKTGAEIGVAFAIASKSIALYSASGDQILNVYRGLRIALSPTLFTAGTLAAGLAVEETLRLVNARAKLISQYAAFAAQNGRSFSSVATYGTTEAIMGSAPGALNQSALGKIDPGVLSAAIPKIQALKDATEQADAVVRLLGKDALAYLPILDARLKSNIDSAYELSTELDHGTRESLGRMGSAIHDITHQFDGFGDSIRLAREEAKQGIVLLVTRIERTVHDAENRPGGLVPGFGTAGGVELSQFEPGFGDANPNAVGNPAPPSYLELAGGFAGNTAGARKAPGVPQSGLVSAGEFRLAGREASAYPNSIEGVSSRLSAAKSRLAALSGMFTQATGDPTKQALITRSLNAAKHDVDSLTPQLEQAQLAKRLGSIGLSQPDNPIKPTGPSLYKPGELGRTENFGIQPSTFVTGESDITSANAGMASAESERLKAYGEGLLSKYKGTEGSDEEVRRIRATATRSEAERQIRSAGLFAEFGTDETQVGIGVRSGQRSRLTSAYMRGGVSQGSVSSSVGKSERLGEAQAITRAYNERTKIIESQAASEQASNNKIVDVNQKRIADEELIRRLADERGQAELDRTKAILDLRSKQYTQDKEAFTSTVTGGFTALTHGSDAFGRFAREKAISFGTGIVSNAAGLGFNALTGGAGFHLPGSIVGTAQNPNLFGKLLGKGSFGPDQGGGLQLSQGALKTSTDSLRDAVIANTAVQGRAAGIDTSGIAGVAAVPISGGPLNIPGLGGSTTIYGGSAGQVPYDASPISTTLSDTAAYSRLAASSYGGGASGGAIVGDVGKLAKALGDRSISLGGGNATTLSSLLVPGAMIAGGAVGLYQGIKTGGARGGFESAAGGAGIASGVAGIAGALGVVSPILSALGPIGAIAAPLLGLVSAAFGDPKANFAQKQARDLRNNTYFAPAGQSVVSDTNGGMVSYGANGLPRGGSPYSAFGSSSSPGYFSHYNGYYTPVQAYNNPTFQIPSGQQAPPNPAPPVQQVNLTVHTMDSQSFSDNSGKIADAVKLAMQQGHSVRKEVVSASRLQS